MAMAGPVTIGTRGTVGSLLRKEMDYFCELRLSGNNPSGHGRAKGRNTETTTGRAMSGGGVQRKKKLRVPGICSIMDVAEMCCRREDEVRGFSYRILRGESKDKQV